MFWLWLAGLSMVNTLRYPGEERETTAPMFLDLDGSPLDVVSSNDKHLVKYPCPRDQ
jgi:hypothetical protein